MPEWASYALVFLAGLLVGRLFMSRGDGHRAPGRPLPQAPAEIEARIRELLVARRKIEAIKAYCDATGAELKDALEYVNEVQRRTGLG